MVQKRAKEEYKKLLAVELLKITHFLISCGLFFFFWLLFRYGELRFDGDVGYRYNFFVLAGYAVGLLFFNRTYNAYLLGYTRIRILAFAEFLAQMFSISILYIVVSLAWNNAKNPLYLLAALGAQMFFDIIWAYFANLKYFKIYPPKKTILIYQNAIDKKRFGTITGKPSERLYKIVEEYQYKGRHFSDIKHKLDGYEAVFVAGVDSRCRNGIAKYCKEENIPGFFLPHVGDVIMQEAMHIQSFDSPVLYVTRTAAKPEYRIIKRCFDFVSSLLGLIILSPLMLITAIAIKAYDGGPVLYKQVRLTRDGKHFKILKFRSMKVDAEKDGVARLSSGDNDDRITPVGRIVRKCRLDELPQLINILKGDMSVVGPRPERPEIAEQYYQTIPDFKLRLQVKAGLTGYAQVYGKYNTDPYEKLEFDLLYINNMSVLTDLELMFATFGILFSSESTTGIDAGSVTAMDYEENDENEEEIEIEKQNQLSMIK